MNKRLFALVFISVLLIGIVSAGWFSDFINKLTGNSISVENNCSETLSNPVFLTHFDSSFLDKGDCNLGNQLGASNTLTTKYKKVGTGAGQFSSGGAYVKHNSNLDNLVNEISIALWVYPTKTTNQNEAQWFVAKRDNDNNENGEHSFQFGFNYQESGTKLDFGFMQDNSGDRDWTEWRTVNDIPLNKWSHVAVVYKPYNYIKFYVDGVEQSVVRVNTQWHTTSGYPQIPSTSEDLAIGTRGQFGNYWNLDNFQGYMDELGIWNSVLSSKEISKLAQGGKISCGTCSSETPTNESGSNLTNGSNVSELEITPVVSPEILAGKSSCDGSDNCIVYEGTQITDTFYGKNISLEDMDSSKVSLNFGNTQTDYFSKGDTQQFSDGTNLIINNISYNNFNESNNFVNLSIGFNEVSTRTTRGELTGIDAYIKYCVGSPNYPEAKNNNHNKQYWTAASEDHPNWPTGAPSVGVHTFGFPAMHGGQVSGGNSNPFNTIATILITDKVGSYDSRESTEVKLFSLKETKDQSATFMATYMQDGNDLPMPYSAAVSDCVIIHVRDGTCEDGIQNGDEENVDCGGSWCDKCPMNCTSELGGKMCEPSNCLGSIEYNTLEHFAKGAMDASECCIPASGCLSEPVPIGDAEKICSEMNGTGCSADPYSDCCGDNKDSLVEIPLFNVKGDGEDFFKCCKSGGCCSNTFKEVCKRTLTNVCGSCPAGYRTTKVHYTSYCKLGGLSFSTTKDCELVYTPEEPRDLVDELPETCLKNNQTGTRDPTLNALSYLPADEQPDSFNTCKLYAEVKTSTDCSELKTYHKDRGGAISSISWVDAGTKWIIWPISKRRICRADFRWPEDNCKYFFDPVLDEGCPNAKNLKACKGSSCTGVSAPKEDIGYRVRDTAQCS